ncbi:hypothetical protein sos41_05720 [Alphaproteobacteria bacterium SO-S41]|nr:hypothetical protein sos41_05720 [Alphaproteobacteria bacterium SO-S41]
MLRSILLAAVLLAGSAAAATDCTTAPDQASMNACAVKAYETADAELTKSVATIVDRLKDDAAAAKQFYDSETAWARYRDAHCTFASSGVAGGSIQPFIDASCREALTLERSKTIAPFLNCEEGDLSCPVPAP